MACPAGGISETQAYRVVFFYQLYPTSRFSISLFGGPQHSDTVLPLLPPLQLQLSPVRAWTPAAGATISWQGRLNSLAIAYSHLISGDGPLALAVQPTRSSAPIP